MSPGATPTRRGPEAALPPFIHSGERPLPPLWQIGPRYSQRPLSARAGPSIKLQAEADMLAAKSPARSSRVTVEEAGAVAAQSGALSRFAGAGSATTMARPGFSAA